MNSCSVWIPAWFCLMAKTRLAYCLGQQGSVGFPAWICLMVFLAIGFAAIGLTFRLLTGYRSRNSQSAMLGLIGGFVFVAVTLTLLLGVFYVRTASYVEPATVIATRNKNLGPERHAIPVDSANIVMHPDPNAIAVVQLPSPPTEWMSNDLKAFDADIYPGVEQAAVPLARQVRATLEASRLLETKPNGDGVNEPGSIIIYSSQLGAEARSLVATQFAAEIRKQFEKSVVSFAKPNTEVSSTHGNIVSLSISSQIEVPLNAPWDRTVQVVSRGALRCEAMTTNGRTEVSVTYQDKPWVETFGAFSIARPKQQFIAGYSTSLASSESDARREAMNDAAEKLRQAGFHHFKLEETLASDRFVQKLSRPYGDVWRAAVLFELSSQSVAAHAVRTMNARAAATYTLTTSIRALIFLFVITIVTCVVLNLLTLGYYRLQISLGWAVAVLGVIVASGIVLIR